MIDKDLLDKVSLEGLLRIIINEINNLCEELNKLKEQKTLKFKKLNQEAVIPNYATKGSAGFDFYCLEECWVDVNSTVILKTGLSVEIPYGYFMSIVPRSSTGLKTPLRQSNSYGVIDSDYRGEIGLIFTNTSNTPFKINKGDRLAQGFLIPITQFEILESLDDLSKTERGEGGFGSTGK
jgi:dUTP pyrophosphatase